VSVSRAILPALVVRPMTLDDLDEVLDIERASFIAPWTPDLFVAEFGNPRSVKRVVTVGENGPVIGYVIFWIVLDEAHLMNVAVDEAFKRKGAAKLMLQKMIDECAGRGVRYVTLEVRKSNEAAIELYLRFGFKMVGLRKNYYVHEHEDAIMMELEIS